jgi:hypothetical protein
MKGRRELYILGALLLALVGAGYYFFAGHDTGSGGLPGVFAEDKKFEPLDVREPGLRMDLLERIQKLQYPEGSQRNIFVAAPPPPPQRPANEVVEAPKPFVGPKVPPPPPPLQIPAEFFGYAAPTNGGRRVAFFTSGDDVLVVAEGDTFLNLYRLDRINNDSADVEEISSGRHQTVPLVQPPASGTP